MNMHRPCAAIGLCVFATLAVFAQELPGLGERLSASEIAALDYAVLPNGDGLPAGSGTAQAGAAVYGSYCLACHGDAAAGGPNDKLAGGHGTLTGNSPEKTVGSFWPYATTVFDYVRRSMPLTSPGILTNDELYAVTAYLLYVNDVIGNNEVMNASTLPAVKMPNRDNFVWAYTPSE